jgi:succinate-acetate transporter protein
VILCFDIGIETTLLVFFGVFWCFLVMTSGDVAYELVNRERTAACVLGEELGMWLVVLNSG